VSGRTSHCQVLQNTKYTGRFIMFSVITNIYDKKTKRPTKWNFSQPQEN